MKAKLIVAFISVFAVYIHGTKVMSAPVNERSVEEASADPNSVQLAPFPYENQYYAYVTTRSNFLKMPPWKSRSIEPPLPVSSAALAAEKYARGLFPVDYHLELSEITLTPCYSGDIWYYAIHFQVIPAPKGTFLHGGAYSIGSSEIRVAVLMDGTIPDLEQGVDDPKSRVVLFKNKVNTLDR
jgi:hypothetical protein